MQWLSRPLFTRLREFHCKRTLERLVTGALGIRFTDHLELDDGATIFAHGCKLGCEGIVSKKLGSPYRSGRLKDWVKVKNPMAAAVAREAEEDFGKR
jgi:bifunctional non-homologous end joining protein LigD